MEQGLLERRGSWLALWMGALFTSRLATAQPAAPVAPATSAPAVAPATSAPAVAPATSAPAVAPATSGPAVIVVDAPPRTASAPNAPAAGTSTTAPPPHSPWRGRAALLVPRVALGLFGEGDLELSGHCSGECPLAVEDRNLAATDRTRYLIGSDFLWQLGPPLRLGLAVYYIPKVELETRTPLGGSTGTKKSLGANLDLPILLEVVIPVHPRFGVALRGDFGPSLLFPGGSLGADNRAYAELCRDLDGVDRCRVQRSLRASWTYGGGVGGIVEVGHGIALRADFLAQMVAEPLFRFEADTATFSADQRYRLNGYRAWLALGLEVTQ